MLREIYAIPEDETRYKENVVEINNELDEIIQQVDMILFTQKGDVLLMPDFGCNLEQYLFDTSWDSTIIKNLIMTQIRNFVFTENHYEIDVDVSFIEWDFNVAMMVDLKINNIKLASYLV